MGGNSMNQDNQVDLIRVMIQRTALVTFADLCLSGTQASEWHRWVSLCKALH